MKRSKGLRQAAGADGKTLSGRPHVSGGAMPQPLSLARPSGVMRSLDQGRVAVRCHSSLDLVSYLLDEAHVAVVPGEAFGAPGYLRLSYATSQDKIDEGLRRMAAALAGQVAAR